MTTGDMAQNLKQRENPMTDTFETAFGLLNGEDLPCLFDEDAADQQTENLSLLSFDMWGYCSVRNFKRVVRQNRCLKPLRVHLLKLVLDFCRMAEVEPFVYGGTALAVYREHGNMIKHDHDIDLGVLEYDKSHVGVFTRLLQTCIAHGVPFSGVSCNEELIVASSSDIRVQFASGITGHKWLRLNSDPKNPISEEAYSGADCKRAKFFFTESGLQKVCELNHKKSATIQAILGDPSLVHVDLFTLSPHPDCASSHLRVNWNIPGAYDNVKKPFPISCFLPPKPCVFEGISLLAPANLEEYLTIDYGYLGRDAVYDSKKQVYVMMTEECKHNLFRGRKKLDGYKDHHKEKGPT
ncbi:unnamed protein product [Calicophoron daubneyi]|uniref:Uncharacterized protein n=1 Tax=Calicophoron daubneyi TaxID=300641 RepID=A0AAV2TTU4_CALDB